MKAGAWIGMLALIAGAGGGSYRAEVEQFREARAASLRAEDGWLSVAGLFWLREGDTTAGSDPASDLLLPAEAPPQVGTIRLGPDGRATFLPAAGVKVTKNGAPFEGGEVRTDAGGKADVIALGDLRLFVIRRGKRFAVRLKDNRNPLRTGFTGLNWFPVDPAWRVDGRFVAAPSESRLVFDTIVGEQDVQESAGYVEFERGGKTYRLQAAREGDDLWFVFRDGTSGRTTHGGARQLLAKPAENGVVVLDFNKAVNLPCAYTAFATCPLAPPQNRLPFPIEAGEKTYKAGAH